MMVSPPEYSLVDTPIMEKKKNDNVNLEKSKVLFRQMGLILALSMVFIAMEYTTTDIKAESISLVDEYMIEEEIMPITRIETPPPPPPPPPPAFSEVLNIVDDEIELDIELELDDMELDENEEVEIIAFEEETEEDDNFIFQRVEKMPEFPGGYAALAKYLGGNLRFPEEARDNGVQGRVYVKFIVNKEGHLQNIEILKGIDRALDNEAIRVVQQMPYWTPGEQRGRPVNVACNLPITFSLE